ncbi:adenosylcobinamide amidohydrolase [Halomicroarcula sp. GCM10025709]|uniref:adenosylcobinamide amidohydrolase n=1 Tax=Haloarcula TaxID=2237 RepID=UPI0024C35581|nr:adenosylcobinamide amidohydrolase [Halomicroarcula sp. YJ-61-S]
MTFETTVREGICQLRRPDTRWLSTAWDGGYERADAGYNVTVPTGFDRTDLDSYRAERLGAAGVPVGPTLLTGVRMDNARRARDGPVTVVATAGLSNPAVLPVDGDGATSGTGDGADTAAWRPGTVNLLVGVERALGDGALATLLATAVEAKAATLRALAGVPGTTSDAVLVGTAPDCERAAFAGSATPVGAATRACVRDAVAASIDSHYDDGPPAPATTDYGVVTDRQTDVDRP